MTNQVLRITSNGRYSLFLYCYFGNRYRPFLTKRKSKQPFQKNRKLKNKIGTNFTRDLQVLSLVVAKVKPWQQENIPKKTGFPSIFGFAQQIGIYSYYAIHPPITTSKREKCSGFICASEDFCTLCSFLTVQNLIFINPK